MMRINTEMLWPFSSPALEVLIVRLMCGAYLAFINLQTVQVNQPHFSFRIWEYLKTSLAVSVMYLCLSDITELVKYQEGVN